MTSRIQRLSHPILLSDAAPARTNWTAANDNASALRPGLRAAGPKRILLLDPIGLERRLFAALSGAQGHRLRATGDPSALRAMLRQERPDLILMHVCFHDLARMLVAQGANTAPIVLIDSRSFGSGNPFPTGPLPTLRFPIGIEVLAEAIRRYAI